MIKIISRVLILLYSFVLYPQTQLGDTITGFFGSRSGASLSFSEDGRVIIIGGIGATSDDVCCGSVNVYEYQNSSWITVGNEITQPGQPTNFGEAVAASDDGMTIIVGNSRYFNFRGAFSVYQFNGVDWILKGSLVEGPIESQLGLSVDISADGNRVVVSQPRIDSTGEIKIYDFINDEWLETGQITSQDFQTGEQLGKSISMSSDGMTIAVGSPSYEAIGTVRIFSENSGQWTQKGENIIIDTFFGDFGISVSLDDAGELIAIGDPRFNDNTGLINVYKFENGEWIELGEKIIDFPAVSRMGNSVQLSGDGQTLTGSSQNGELYVYRWENDDWVQIGQATEGYEEDSPLFFLSAAISGDGTTVAVGFTMTELDSGETKVFDISQLLSVNSSQPKASDINIIQDYKMSNLLIYEGTILIENKLYSLFDINGRKLADGIVREGVISTSNLNAGIYLLQLDLDSKKAVQKFIKLKR